MSPLFLLGAVLLSLVSPSSQFDDEGIRIVRSHVNGRFKRQMDKARVKWADNTVSYHFEDPNAPRVKVMRAGMDYIAHRTCIRFQEDRDAPQKLFISESGKTVCTSDIGAPGIPSNVSGTTHLFSKDCFQLGFAVHELSHTLGSFHEQSRPDRDNYLTVDLEKIKKLEHYQENFEKQPERRVETLVPFEYGSLLMYPTHANGERVMSPKDPKYEYTMGNRRVGFYDILKINKYYKCKCEKDLECANGGYTSPADCSKCLCPSGYFGNLCHERPRKNHYELAASDNWQKKTISFKYEFDGDNFQGFSSSFAYINAPNDMKVEVQLTEMEDVVCHRGCNENGVEVKTNEDIRSVSPIVCCKNQTFSEQVFTSKNNPTIIEFYSSVPQPSKVSFLYRFV